MNSLFICSTMQQPACPAHSKSFTGSDRTVCTVRRTFIKSLYSINWITLFPCGICPVAIVHQLELHLCSDLHVGDELSGADCLCLGVLTEELLFDVLVQVVLALQARLERGPQGGVQLRSLDKVPVAERVATICIKGIVSRA